MSKRPVALPVHIAPQFRNEYQRDSRIDRANDTRFVTLAHVLGWCGADRVREDTLVSIFALDALGELQA